MHFKHPFSNFSPFVPSPSQFPPLISLVILILRRTAHLLTMMMQSPHWVLQECFRAFRFLLYIHNYLNGNAEDRFPDFSKINGGALKGVCSCSKKFISTPTPSIGERYFESIFKMPRVLFERIIH